MVKRDSFYQGGKHNWSPQAQSAAVKVDNDAARCVLILRERSLPR